MAEETGRCEVRTGCYVRKISTDKAGRVDGAVYFDSQRQEQFQKAKAVVLCANGAETPRLLLLSKSNLFPDGLANSNGLVGKYLMFDCDSGANGIFEHPLNEYKSVVVTRVIHDFYDSDPKRGFYGGGGMDARLEAYPVEYALFSTPPGTPKWGAGFKRSLRENYNRQLMILTHLTTLPLESNTITLDPEVKDAWGLPAMRVTYKNHPDDLKNMAFFSDRALELLDAAGAQKKWAIEPAGDHGFRAPDGYLPHGQRSESVGGGQIPPCPRCPEPFYCGRKQFRDQRAKPADLHDPGPRLPRFRLHCPSSQERKPHRSRLPPRCGIEARFTSPRPACRRLHPCRRHLPTTEFRIARMSAW